MLRRRRFLREPRSGGIPVATGVSPWNGVSEQLKPRSGDTRFVVTLPRKMNSKQDSRRMVSRLRRSVLDRIRFHGLTPLATGIPPLRGSRRKRLRRGTSYIQNVQTPGGGHRRRRPPLQFGRFATFLFNVGQTLLRVT